MKKLIILIFLFAVTSAGYTQFSFSDGLAKATKSGKMVLVNVYSANDKWSQMMDANYEKADIKNLIEKYFVYVKLNAEGEEKYTYNGKQYTSSNLAKLFGGTGYPSHIVLSSDGKVIKFIYNNETTGVFSGYLDEREFLKYLTYFGEGKYKDTDLSKYF